MPAPLTATELSAAAYLSGTVSLLACGVAVGWGTWSLRRLLLPQWSGARARLAEVVVGLATAIGIAQLLGSLGVFNRLFMLVACLGAGLGLGAFSRALRAPGSYVATASAAVAAASARRHRTGGVEMLAASVAVALVGVQWISHVAYALDRGMTHPDTLWFHGPYAARFVGTEHITELLDGVDLLHAYSTHNSELVHAVAILPFDRDILSPFINMGWAALALLAAWVLGRRRRVEALSLLGAAVVLGLPIAAATQPGQASNDIAASALLLAAVALLVEGDLAPGPTVLAAMAAGLSLGTRLTVAAIVAFLSLGVVVFAWRKRRVVLGVTWCAVLAVSGGYWFVRNWQLAGNPFPFFGIHIGPLDLDRVVKPGESFSQYWTDGFVWREVFLPGLRQGLGAAWPVVLGVAVASAVLALWQRNNSLERLAGATVLVGVVAYMFTPLTADGGGLAFAFNLRYLMPALLLGFALGPWALESVDERVRVAAVVGALALLAVGATARHHEGTPAWRGEGLVFALLFGGAVLIAGPSARWLRRHRPYAVVIAVTTVVLGIACGWLVQRHYLEHRYDDAGLALDRISAIVRDRSGERIATFGLFEYYPLFGADLSNAVVQPRGQSKLIPMSCSSWRRLLADGDYTYVVIGRQTFGHPGPFEHWIADDPATSLVRREEAATMFRIHGPLDPEGCARS